MRIVWFNMFKVACPSARLVTIYDLSHSGVFFFTCLTVFNFEGAVGNWDFAP